LRVSPAFDTKLREIAAREGRTFAEVLERALAAYEASMLAS
jgi:predicted transcriptional regulator